MNETLDLLDENGKPTGSTAPRKEVHRHGLWHATVHVYVYRTTGEDIEILTHLRSPHKDLYPNTWDPVLGGHVITGHTPIQTVIEELSDEIGIRVYTNNLVVGPVIKANKGLDKEFNHVFTYSLPPNTTLHFKDKEVKKVRWMKLGMVLQAIQKHPSKWRPTSREFSDTYATITSLLRR